MFKSVTFEVIGDQRLACEGCEERVEHLLKALQGVRQVRARKQRIEVLFDAATLDTALLALCLRTAGYETKLGGSTSKSTR